MQEIKDFDQKLALLNIIGKASTIEPPVGHISLENRIWIREVRGRTWIRVESLTQQILMLEMTVGALMGQIQEAIDNFVEVDIEVDDSHADLIESLAERFPDWTQEQIVVHSLRESLFR